MHPLLDDAMYDDNKINQYLDHAMYDNNYMHLKQN